jgi:hydrogenase-4 component F
MNLTNQIIEILVLLMLAGPFVAGFFGFWLPRFSLTAGSLLSLSVTLVLVISAPASLPVHFTFGLNFYLDDLGVYFLLLTNLVAVFSAWYVDYQGSRDPELGSGYALRLFHTLFGIFQFTLLLVLVVNDLFALWLIVELTTVVSVVLLLHSSAPHAAEAGWKYLYATIPGLIFTFLAMILLVSTLPANAVLRWSDLSHFARELDPRLASLVFVCALLGYGAKAGLAPLHTWLPDVHGEAPAPVSAMLSGVLLKIALFALLRWASITNLALGNRTFTSGLFMAFGLLSITIATLAIPKANKFKRVLAYHSLEHMGIIAFALGIGTPLAILGALLHTLFHALVKSLMFLTFGNIRQRYAAVAWKEAITASGESRVAAEVLPIDEDHIQGVFKALPASGALLGFGGLALVGSPPFCIFLSEFIILWAAIRLAWEGHNAIIITATGIFVISIILIFGGLISHLSKLLLDVPPAFVEREKWYRLWPLFVLLGLILLAGLFLPISGSLGLWNLLEHSACIVLGGASGC